MGWHDARVHAFAFEPDTWELLLDLDYIFEWINPVPDETHYSFFSAPATMVFENVSDLAVHLEPYPAFELSGIERSDPQATHPAEHEAGERHWLWTLDFFNGEITFRSTGYKLHVRREPIRITTQGLSLEERGGLSFARSRDHDQAV